MSDRRMTDDEIDELFGYSDGGVVRRTHGYSPAPPREPGFDDVHGVLLEPLPEAAALADEQRFKAIERLKLDTRKYPRMGWRDLDAIVGQIIPGDVVIVGAQPGAGKSLFLRNWWDHLIFTQQKHGTYLGLEDSPEHCRIKWACDRTAVPQKLVLAPPDHIFGTPLHLAAQAVIERELRRFDEPLWRTLHHFGTTRHVTLDILEQWVRWSHAQGATFVIVDHIDRVEVGPGINTAAEMARAIVRAKELAEELRMVIILASQVKRPQERVLSLAPPTMEDLAGSASKERESSIILALWRMMRDDVSEADIRKVKLGLNGADVTTLWEPGAMGVRCLKHRLDGDGFGKQARLRVRGSRVIDWVSELLPMRPCWHCGTPLTVAEMRGWGACDGCFKAINAAA